jgi:MFS family permease
VYVATLALSITAALFIPASNALMKERIAPAHLGRFNANYEIASQAGFLLSAAAGGWLVQVLDAKAVFFINALTFVGSAICIYSMGPRPAFLAKPPAPASTASATEETTPAIRPVVRLAMLYIVGSVVILVVNMILLVLVVQRFRQGAGVLGLVDAAAGIGILIAAWHYKRIKDRFDYKALIVFGYVGTGIVDMLMPIHVATLLPLILLGGYTFGVARLAARTTLMKVIDADKAGRVFGTVNAVGLAISLVATIGLAKVTDTAGVVTSFILLGLWGIVPTILIVGTLLRTRLDDPVVAAEPALNTES